MILLCRSGILELTHKTLFHLDVNLAKFFLLRLITYRQTSHSVSVCGDELAFILVAR